MHRTTPPLPPTKNSQAPNVNSAEAEQPRSRGLKTDLCSFIHLAYSWRLTFALWLLLMVNSSCHLMESSHKPLLDVLYYGEKTGLEALTCPRPCYFLGSQQRPVLLPLPPGLRLRHLPAYLNYNIIGSITEVFFFFSPELWLFQVL